MDEETVLAAVRGYVCDTMRCSSDRIMSVHRFEDGNRHAVYKVSYIDAAGDTRDVVVRVSVENDPANCAVAEREAAVLRTVHGVAGPLLYDFGCKSRWFKTPAMCMQFLSGHHREMHTAAPADIERLGSLVGWVHARPSDDLLESFGPNCSLASYAEQRLKSIMSGLAWVRDPLPAPMQSRIHAVATSLEQGWNDWRDAECFTTNDALALLHGDPGPGNILWGPNPVLIDWEYARLGDPADEIAYLYDQHGLDTHQRTAFWRGYQRSAGKATGLEHLAHRIAWWEPVTLLGSTLWWVERWVRRIGASDAGTIDSGAPKEPEYYFDHIVGRLHRLNRLRGDDRGD
jgi:aminoglycoside phosphotransferase (APT) family kinase protein